MCAQKMDLQSILAKQKLPCMVKNKQALTRDTEETLLPSGSQLILHFITVETRIKVIDNITYRVFYLPLTSRQLFERLPTDPRLDDIAYSSVRDVLHAKTPFPNLLRCTQEYYTDDILQCLYVGDVMEVHEMTTDRYDRYLSGINIENNRKLRLAEKEITAHFTTMPSETLVHASALAKLKMPQRVRIQPRREDHVLVLPKDLQHLNLLSVDQVQYVIATSPKSSKLFGIPANIESVNAKFSYSISSADSSQRALLESLKPLYKTTNLSVGFEEVGVSNLPQEWEAVPQPLSQVLEQWRNSYEGKIVSREINDVDIQELKEDLAEAKGEVDDLMFQLCEYKKDKKLVGYRPPAVPPHDPVSDTPPPPRPPKRSLSSNSSNSEAQSESSRDSCHDYVEIESPGNQSSTSRNSGVDYEALTTKLKAELHRKDMIINELELKAAELKLYQSRCLLLEKGKETLTTRITDLENRLDTSINNNGYYEELPDEVTHSAEKPKKQRKPAYEPLHLDVDGRNVGPITDMSVDEVCELLHSFGLGQYTQIFKEEVVDGNLLVELDRDILIKDLKMRTIDATKLIDKINRQKML